jgi:hypothetical protein
MGEIPHTAQPTMNNKEEARKILQRIKELTNHGRHLEAQALYEKKIKKQNNR